MQKRWTKNFNFLNILLLGLFIGGLVTVVIAFFIKQNLTANFIAAASSLIAGAGSLGTYMTVREMQEEKISRNQPSVYVDFTFQASSMVHFIVRNTSNNLARNVRIDFDVSPIDYSGRKLSEKGWLQNPINIGPNSQETDFVDMSFSMLDGVKPTKFCITVRFQNEDGYECQPRFFKFDLSHKEQQILPPETADDHLEKVAKELEKFNRNFESITRFGSLITEEHTKNVERLRRISERRQARSVQVQKDKKTEG